MRIRNWMKARVAPTVDPTKKVDHHRAQGCVTTDDYFLCECGGVTKNKAHDISCHLTKVHNKNSAYQMCQFKGRLWTCADCRKVQGNFHSFLAHYRRCPHQFRGDSSNLRQQNDPHRPTSTLQREFQRWVQRGKSSRFQLISTIRC
ncbi:hypothetical protein F4776DRAFT_665458 [Hypoxylon sp. NC0597]|nr:hypothetical protein F4776DRAFT_665458 [Hypoxylon sp. NC0597]